MKPVALALLGPTASGKSALALRLAERLELEIVSVDSGQVYRGMDIGTAKPSSAERRRAPHHLIDLLEPTESYSAGRFRADAIEAVGAILARGRLPLLVGGTMLYYRALAQGIDALPTADPALRAAIDREAKRGGWPALHAELARLDPESAARIEPTDAQRIQRALEVHRHTGRPLSEHHRSAAAAAPDFAALAISLDTGPLHLAVALGTPVVSLIGYTNPARHGPYRRFQDLIISAYGETTRDGALCTDRRPGRMPHIAVGDVLNAIDRWRAAYERTD